MPSRPARSSVFRQPAKRAALHQPGGASPRLLATGARHRPFRGAHAPCDRNVARSAGSATIESPTSRSWGSRPMRLQCRPLRGLPPSPRSGRHCISLAAPAPGCGAVTPGPIFGVPAARQAGGIPSAWRRQPQVAVPIHPARFSVFRQPAKRAALHQPGGVSPRLLATGARHRPFRGAHAPCDRNVARSAGSATIESPTSRSWGSRPMRLQCRPLRGLPPSPQSGRHSISLAASAPGCLQRVLGIDPSAGLTPHAIAMSPAPRARRLSNRQPLAHGAHAPCDCNAARSAGSHPAREAGGIPSAWRRQPQVAVPLHPARSSVFRQPAKRAAFRQPGGASPRLLATDARHRPFQGAHAPCDRNVARSAGSHPAREAGGIASAWRRQPQAAVPSRPAPFLAFTQPAERAALH